jgi:hypothetical protein
MAGRDFLYRLEGRYGGDQNDIESLVLQRDIEGEWRPVDLSARSPGFELFCCALMSCQHLYFRVNCAENGLLLTQATGELHVTTDEDWHIQHLLVSFSGHLRSGQPSAALVDYIIERMHHCPVSSNLRPIEDLSVLLAFVEPGC